MENRDNAGTFIWLGLALLMTATIIVRVETRTDKRVDWCKANYYVYKEREEQQ